MVAEGVMGARVVTVNEVLGGHVALDIECLDRVYLNAYAPILQSSGQVVAARRQCIYAPLCAVPQRRRRGELLAADALVYARYSAGPCVLSPSLRGLELVDDPDAVTRAYGAPPVWDGLALLDEAFVPHYRSPGHPETAAIEQVVARYRAEGVAYRTLHDGQALVVDGADTVTV
jgi:hypothetical protein